MPSPYIISKSTKEAVLNKDEQYIRNLLKRQIETNPDWIDLNIGPAKGAFAGTMKWLVDIAQSMTDIPLSLDSTNADEIEIDLRELFFALKKRIVVILAALLIGAAAAGALQVGQ